MKFTINHVVRVQGTYKSLILNDVVQLLQFFIHLGIPQTDSETSIFSISAHDDISIVIIILICVSLTHLILFSLTCTDDITDRMNLMIPDFYPRRLLNSILSLWNFPCVWSICDLKLVIDGDYISSNVMIRESVRVVIWDRGQQIVDDHLSFIQIFL